MDLYLSVGIPNGFTELLDGAIFAPVLLSVNQKKISSAGSTIQAVVKGMGVNDEIILVDAASSSTLCLTSRVLEYGILECDTDPAFDFGAAPIQLGVKEITSGVVSACQNTDLTQCQVELVGAVQPEYTAVVIASSKTQMDFTGTAFDTSGDFTCEVTFANAKSDSCTIVSPTVVQAVWDKGVAI